MNSKIFFNKKGQTVILIAILILGAILAISAGLITLTIKEMKMGKNVKESIQSFAAADAGMEYILFKKGSIKPQVICPNWQKLLEGKSWFCVENSEKGYVSIGRSGMVMRAILTPSPFSIDQFAKITDREEHENKIGHDICKCRGDFGGLLEDWPYAQTFLAGRTGLLYEIGIYVKIGGGDLEDAQLKAEIRNIDETYTDPFSPLAAKPESIAVPVPDPRASTTDFQIIEIGDCDAGACKSDISFIFHSPALVIKGKKYALVVYYENPGPYIHWAACCTERRYIPGKGWRWNGDEWLETLGSSSAEDYKFDLEFATYTFSYPGGEFEEVKP